MQEYNILNLYQDKRYLILKERLSYLTLDQLNNILNYKEDMVLDTYNFDGEKYCALCVAFELEKKFPDKKNINDNFIRNEIIKIGKNIIDNFNINPTKGVEGNFFTSNRKEDLIWLIKETIKERYND